MKARSVILAQIQTPQTIAGLPPVMFATVFGGIMVTYLLGAFYASPLVALTMCGLVAVGGFSACYWAVRNNHHTASVFLTSLAFWSLTSRRWLLAGAARPCSWEDRK